MVGIVTGFVVAYGLLAALRRDRWTAVFLATTAATTLTGFLFPSERFLPSHGVGIVSLAVLPIAIVARYRYRLTGPWRIVYVVAAMLSLYLNVFVLIAQAFQKVSALHTLAPTQSEAPFQIAQLLILVLFIVLTTIAILKFRLSPKRAIVLES
jgi:hypothetical protein